MLVLNESEVSNLIDMDGAIAAMRDLLTRTQRGDIEIIPRRRLQDGPMYMAMMAASDTKAHLFAAKLYTTGARRGSFKLLLWDSKSGQLLAILDANRLGQLRTGAISAVATDLLARKDADTMLLIGTGYQAETQVIAISRVRTLKTIYIHSRNPDNRATFVKRLREQLPESTALISADSVEAYAGKVDIIVTATTAREPVIHGTWLRPGTHINAIGSNHPTDRELDSEVLHRATIVTTDHLGGAKLESGDLLLGLSKDEWLRVQPLDGAPRRQNANAITVFVSQGIASEDLVLAQYVLERWNGA